MFQLNKRAEDAIAAKKNSFRLLKEGVSVEAQHLFQTIRKT